MSQLWRGFTSVPFIEVLQMLSNVNTPLRSPQGENLAYYDFPEVYSIYLSYKLRIIM